MCDTPGCGTATRGRGNSYRASCVMGVGESDTIRTQPQHMTTTDPPRRKSRLRWRPILTGLALLISLGADNFDLAPIGGLALTSATYAQIGQRLAQLNLPTVFIMEGGYAIAQLGENVANLLKGFGH